MTGNSSVSSKESKRNPVAQDLRSAKYRARVVASRKAYKRKGRLAQLDRATDFYSVGRGFESFGGRH